MQGKTLGELAKYVGGRVNGDPNLEIRSVATLTKAGEGDISFLANAKYEKLLLTTKASAVIVGSEIPAVTALLVAEDPYYAFMQIVVLLHGYRKHQESWDKSEGDDFQQRRKVGVDCHIHDFVTISDGAKIGNNCIIYPGVFIGENSQLGNDCIIYPNVTIYDGSKIGNRVIINSNAVVGEDGFGFATHKGIHYKIPHTGTVILEDDVEIGSCCGIERGTLGDTIIGQGSKLGDLVAIGHGARVGSHCLLVAQVGIAGSTTLGHHCVIGGQAGIAGHLTIGNAVTIAAQAGVINNLTDGQIVVGAPAIESNLGKRAYSLIQALPQMRQSLNDIEKRLAELEGK